MLKLCFFHDGPIFYDSTGNYYEYSYHNLYERYKYIADEVTFVIRVVPLDSDTKNTLMPKEINVIPIPNFKIPSKYFKLKKEADKIIQRTVKNTDVLIMRGGSSCTNIAIKYAKKYKKPYIFECVGCVFDALWNYSFLGMLMAPFCFIAEKKRIKRSNYVCYVTNKFLQKRYPTYGISIGCSNVVICEPQYETIKKRLNKLKYLSPKSKIILGTAASLDVRFKGQEYVIRAIPVLLKRGYNVYYHLAGGNRHHSTFLRDLAQKCGVSDRIIFCGSLPSDKMNEFYDNIDIYIQPSKQEGLPRSVIEAMSRGCPIIGTNIAGIPELISKDCLFSKGSTKSVIQSTIKMINSDMMLYAFQNYEKSKEYTQQILSKRRRDFYDIFIQNELGKTTQRNP